MKLVCGNCGKADSVRVFTRVEVAWKQTGDRFYTVEDRGNRVHIENMDKFAAECIACDKPLPTKSIEWIEELGEFEAF